jgi:nitrogen fixation/metabolism regulation signal transduction histidine kinase
MVTTLDAQNRRLVDLETMAGWREMARALAHEVKNPLTPIQLTVEEMQAQYKGEDAEYRRLLEECTRIVVEEVESLRNVVGRFREFSRPVELRPRPQNVNALLRDLGALQKDMRVEYELDPELEKLTVSGDADRLRQLFINLAENARQAQESDEDPRLWLGSSIEDGFAVLSVEDAGPGIPEEQRARVFDPYHSAKAGGLGLGLSLVKGIALAHGGRIELGEGRAGGAVFRVHLPLAPEEA